MMRMWIRIRNTGLYATTIPWNAPIPSHRDEKATTWMFIVHGTFFRIDKVVAVSSSKIFLNWTVDDWNSPVTGYSLSYREEGDDSWRYHQVRIVNYGAARRSSEGCCVAQ
jgi:hypothetical protein